MGNQFDLLMDQIITDQEGGWKLSKDADGGDGGWTYGGMTAKTFNSYCDHLDFEPVVDYEQAAELIEDEQERQNFKSDVLAVYHEEFVAPLNLPIVADEMRGPLLSCAINCGEHFALFLFHDCAGNRNFFLEQWVLHYQRIVLHNPDKEQFLKGWKNRVAYWFSH